MAKHITATAKQLKHLRKERRHRLHHGERLPARLGAISEDGAFEAEGSTPLSGGLVQGSLYFPFGGFRHHLSGQVLS